VAATFEKAITYDFAELVVRDREVGGSNPLAPTSQINNLRLPVVAAVFLVWPICGHFVQVHLSLQLNGPNVLGLGGRYLSIVASLTCSTICAVSWRAGTRVQVRES
jgi:hypothetical protein